MVMQKNVVFLKQKMKKSYEKHMQNTIYDSITKLIRDQKLELHLKIKHKKCKDMLWSLQKKNENQKLTMKTLLMHNIVIIRNEYQYNY
jgi:hypothetical protein